MEVCNRSMFCCALLCVRSGVAIILVGRGGGLIALLNLSSWCLMMVEWLFLAVPRGCLQFVIVVFPDHTHLLFLYYPVVLYLFSFSLQYPGLSSVFRRCFVRCRTTLPKTNLAHIKLGPCQLSPRCKTRPMPTCPTF